MRRKEGRIVRLVFTPSRTAREYFDGLVKRLTAERGIEAHVTYREAFDHMVKLSMSAESVLREQETPARLVPERFLRTVPK